MSEEKNVAALDTKTILGGDEWSNFLSAVRSGDWDRSVALAKAMLRARVGDKEFEVNLTIEFQRQWGKEVAVNQVKSICIELEAEAAKVEAERERAKVAAEVIELRGIRALRRVRDPKLWVKTEPEPEPIGASVALARSVTAQAHKLAPKPEPVKPEPVAEPEPEPQPEPEEPDTWADEPWDEPEDEEADEGAVWTTADRFGVTLSRKAPLDNAKQFMRDRLELSARGKPSGPGTYFYQGTWWQWNGAFYEHAAEQRIADMVTNYLDKAKVKSDEGPKPFKPTPRDLSSLMTFLRSCVGLDDRDVPPRWLDDRRSPVPEGLLAFRNCLVDVHTGKTHPHEPWLWMHDGVDFDYDPDARCPRWEQFLRELFPVDPEAREMIEEELGYGMTIDNQFEKAALWIGPPRSGRGTLARIQELLVGHNGHTSLNIHTWHNNENSRQGMIGKRVGIFHDIRLKPGRQFGNVSYDPGGVDPQSQQLLLELISGDLTEIGRKYLEAWKGKPFIKFRLISNTVPNFNDEVLITRFNALEFKQSFLGREDTTLKSIVLPAELPGIANRCLAAYRRLLRNGQFIQPESGLALLGRVKAAARPYGAFMNAYWDPDPLGDGILIPLFAATFRHWCVQTERFDLAGTSKSKLIQEIKSIPKWAYLKPYRPSDNSDNPPRRYRLKLKPGAKIPDEVLRGDYYTDTEKRELGGDHAQSA